MKVVGNPLKKPVFLWYSTVCILLFALPLSAQVSGEPGTGTGVTGAAGAEAVEEAADSSAAPMAPADPEEQGIDMERVYAEREFEFGVRAYHRGEFNRAIQAFEEALSYKQDFPLAKRWMAEAYFRSGYMQTALDMWRQQAGTDEASSALETRVRTLQYRRGLEGELLDNPEYVSFHSLEAQDEGVRIFNRPTSVRSTDDGASTSWPLGLTRSSSSMPTADWSEASVEGSKVSTTPSISWKPSRGTSLSPSLPETE